MPDGSLPTSTQLGEFTTFELIEQAMKALSQSLENRGVALELLSIAKIQAEAGAPQMTINAINDAGTHLNIARSSLDVLHDVFAVGDDVLKESVAGCMDGMIYGILEHVREAERLLNEPMDAQEVANG